jgi:hypothetical protein
LPGLLPDSLQMPLRFLTQTLAFRDCFCVRRLAQALDLTIQPRQTLFNTGRARLGILLSLGGCA